MTEARMVEEYHQRLAVAPLSAMRVRDLTEALLEDADLADKRAAQFLLDEMSKENQ